VHAIQLVHEHQSQ